MKQMHSSLLNRCEVDVAVSFSFSAEPYLWNYLHFKTDNNFNLIALDLAFSGGFAGFGGVILSQNMNG